MSPLWFLSAVSLSVMSPGPIFAGDIRRQRASAMRGFRHWRWHLDEVYVKIDGETHFHVARPSLRDDIIAEMYLAVTAGDLAR